MFANLPPLKSLRAFESAARHLSFKAASEELSQTQGAISYQIKILEAFCQTALFTRQVRQVHLTASGKNLYQCVHQLLETLEEKVVEIKPDQNVQSLLTVSVSTFFAMRWLSPRLGRFMNDNAGITLSLQHSVNDPDFFLEPGAMAVRWGDGIWPGYVAVELFSSPMIALCSPKILEAFDQTRNLEGLSNHVLLSDQQGNDGWHHWLQLAGISRSNKSSRSLIIDPNVRVQSAIDGQGFILGNRLLADDIESGRLVEPFDVRLQGMGFYLVFQEQSLLQLQNRKFHDWILQEIKGDIDNKILPAI